MPELPAARAAAGAAVPYVTVPTYGTRCHLCRHDGADSADHLTPRAVAPELTWQLDNLRPAHHAPCPTCGVRCNASRGAKPLSAARPAYLDATSYID